MDEDDWLYISVGRHAIPLWGYWNPSRVFPEVLMPFCGEVPASIVYPVCGDYVKAISIVCAFVLAGAIAGYAYSFMKLLMEKWECSAWGAGCLSVSFLILHFLIFRSSLGENDWLFYSTDVACCFYYTIPTLLNASLVLYFMCNGTMDEILRSAHHPMKNAVLVFVLYLAVFSNLFCSIVLAGYVITDVMLRFIQTPYKRRFLFQNKIALVYLGCWGISHVLELSGGRAEDVSEDNRFWQQLGMTIDELGMKSLQVNHTFVILSVISLVVLMFTIKRSRWESRIPMIVPGVICLVYLILLSAATVPHYIWRPEVLLGFCFYVFLFLMVMLREIGRYTPTKVHSLFPIFILFLWGETVYTSDTHNRTFRDRFGTNPLIAKQKVTSIVNQFLEADKTDSSSVVIQVPEDAPFQMNETSINLLGLSMYKHGIVSRRFNVDVKFEQTHCK